MTVAQWHDLAIFFVHGVGFVGFVYEYKGWHSSYISTVPPRPPSGAKLTPSLETNGGITVGDVVSRPAHYSPKDSQELIGGVSLLIAPHNGTRKFVVTGMEVVNGNCGE